MSRNTYVLLATLGSAALLLGAFAFQHLGGLAPCKLCLWQRWPHAAAIIIGIIVLFGAPRALIWFGVEVLAWPYVLHRWRTGPWRAQRQRSFVDGRPFGFGHVRRDCLADVRAVDGGMERRHQRCLTWPVGRGCACKTLG